MRRTTCLAALALVAGLAAGCGHSDPKPKFGQGSYSADPSTSPAAPSSSAPPGPPQIPAAAKQNTRAGAEAFIRYFVAASNYTVATGDTSPLAHVSDDYCEGCRSGIEKIKKEKKLGYRAKGGTWTIDSVTMAQLRSVPGHPMEVTVHGHTAREIVVHPDGNRDLYPAGKVVDNFTILPDATTGWRILEWHVGS